MIRLHVENLSQWFQHRKNIRLLRFTHSQHKILQVCWFCCVLQILFTLCSAIVAYIDKQKPLRRFSVVYAKASSRKHKRWENDGILIAQHNTLLLESMDDGQKRVAASYKNNKVEVEELGAGLSLLIGGFEVQIQNEIFEQTFGMHFSWSYFY